MERYNRRINHGELSKDLFQHNRFFAVRDGDTHYASLKASPKRFGAPDYYENLKERYTRCDLVGDKIPSLYKQFTLLWQVFPNAKVLYIYRNIFDVAQSYNARVKQGNKWRANMDSRRAVKDWNSSLKSALNEAPEENLLPIPYEELFLGQYDCRKILSFLSLSETDEFETAITTLRAQAKDLEKNRQVSLSSIEKRHICQHADFSSYEKLNVRYGNL
jgi:hypothetical protein